MNSKHFIGILILLAGASYLGWQILHMEKGKSASLHDHGHDHGNHEEHEEHGKHHDHHGHDHGKPEYVKLSPAQVRQSGIIIEEARPTRIQTTLKLFGKIGPNEDRVAHVLPRYSGIVKKVNKRVGDIVQRGDVLAIIESSESLQPYEVRSDIMGTVVEKDITLGEVVTQDKRVFVIVDLSTVWVNLNVYRQDFSKIRLGQKLMVVPSDGKSPIETKISYLSPFGSDNTQTLIARAEVLNTENRLRPGLFVEGYAVLEDAEVKVAVMENALQTLENKTVLFVREIDGFEIRLVQLGRKGSGWVEIVHGLSPGERYVSTNSFILKAEHGKASAVHDH